MTLICPHCNEILLPDDVFCSTCGNQINATPTNVSIGKQIYIYAISILLPPFGLIWTVRFFRNTTEQKKRIAIIAATLTLASLIFTLWLSIGFLQGIQYQINTYQNLGI